MGKNEDVTIVMTLSTGLALKRTKPHRVPQKYLDGSLKDAISYTLRTIEQEGDDQELMLMANIQDHMASRQYTIRIGEKNVTPDINFGELVEQYTQIETTGEKDDMVKYREVNLAITKVEEGGE